MLNDPNYVFGDQNVQVPAHLNFGKFMLNHLRKFNKEIALVNTKTGEELSYKELVQNAIDLSTGLYDLGIKKGETVAFGSEKRNDYIPTVFAIIFTGATFTPIDLLCGRAALRHKLEITNPKYLVCTKVFWTSNKDTLKSIKSIKIIITLDEAPDFAIPVSRVMTKHVDCELFEPAQVAGQTDVVFVLYSSGTTGMPKGVMLTHENCILNSLTHDFSDTSLKVVGIYAEWYHNYDIFMTCKFLALGRKIVYHPEYTSDEILVKNIHYHEINIAILVPATVAFLSMAEIEDKYKMESIKVLYSRSAPLHAKTIDQVKLRFPNLEKVLQGYGMTEAGELTSESWVTRGYKPGSVGMASPGITIKVVDPETHQVVGANQRGEICVRGPVLMKGYIGVNPESYMDKEGFLKTGDLGYYDDDGYFFIVDRIKEIIPFYGYEVAPLELETILQLHPEVREAGVVGKPDPIIGELPTAFVVRQPGSTVTEEELVNYTAVEVAHYMQLRGGVIFIEEIPRNPRKKILRKRLREMLHELEKQ